MNILHISPLVSQQKLADIATDSSKDPGYAVQKFNRYLCKGFAENRHITTVLSAIPISRSTSRKLLWNCKQELEDGIVYRYIPFINFPILRNLCLLLYTFSFVFFWGIKNRGQKVVTCDVLAISVCIGALLACKLIGIKSVGIMTDMPGLMITSRERSLKKSIITAINKSYLNSFSHYVFLTKQMEDVINTKHRPYIIMEGLVDPHMADKFIPTQKEGKRIVMYAGGLFEKYGLKTFTEAFHRINDPNICLYLYGTGPFVDELLDYCKKDNRIIYKGLAPNQEVIDMELKSTLLVNPRPTNEEFTKYSFPSKNVEYMVSATPLLTTKLPGMPAEYYGYVYLIEDETIDGYKKALEEVLHKSNDELYNKGQAAKKFVLERKNYTCQVNRIIEMVQS